MMNRLGCVLSVSYTHLIHHECELNKQEITQNKTDINDRINIIEETRTRQLEAIELRQADLALTHTTLGCLLYTSRCV